MVVFAELVANSCLSTEITVPCWDYSDIPGSRCEAQKYCADVQCTYPQTAADASNVGYGPEDVNASGVLIVDNDANCPETARDYRSVSLAQECKEQQTGGYFSHRKSVASKTVCYEVYPCASNCQSFNQYHTGLSFVVNGETTHFKIPKYFCKGADDRPAPEYIEIDYFQCQEDSPCPQNGGGSGGSGG
jgi:hypothetical protein